MYIVDYLRSPHVYSYQQYQSITATDLASRIIRPLLERNGIRGEDVEHLIVGNTSSAHEVSNIARAIAINAGMPHAVGTTINQNCSSGLEALEIARRMIACKEADLIVVGGVENFGRIPLTLSHALSRGLMLFSKKGWDAKKRAFSSLLKLKWSDLAPLSPIKQGLVDPFAKLTLGEMADQLALEFSISREAQDSYARNSHLLASMNPHPEQIHSLIIEGQPICSDLTIKSERTEADYAKKDAYYFRSLELATVTSWNSSPITDGAAFVIVASESAIKRFQLRSRAKIHKGHSLAVLPEKMGLAPFYSMEQLLKVNNLSPKDIWSYEINEAFAAQIIANIKLIESNWGSEVLSHINRWGGSLALGHPFGATGVRLVGNIIHQLEAANKRYGIASICVAQGIGHSLLVERVGEGQ